MHAWTSLSLGRLASSAAVWESRSLPALFFYVYAGNSTAAANLIPIGVPTSLGVNTTFTIQMIPLPPAAAIAESSVR